MSKANSKEDNGKNMRVSVKKDVKIKDLSAIEGRFLFVRVGDDKNPATQEQIDNVKSSLLELFEKNNVNCLTFVTHHAVDVTIF
ncbi:MAG TPA: hypothetical protein VMV95_03520 [Bacillota bacterium]|nr:hypothetical protein [Bacillota bacterium]